MSETPPPVPAELTAWIHDTALSLEAAARRLRRAADRDQTGMTVEEWLNPVLSNAAVMSRRAGQAEHLLTAWALRSGAIGAAKLAQITGVTITAATSRAGSKITRDTWPKVFGD